MPAPVEVSVPLVGLPLIVTVNNPPSGSVALLFRLMVTGAQAKVVILKLLATGGWLVTVMVTVAVPARAVVQASAAAPDRCSGDPRHPRCMALRRVRRCTECLRRP